MLKNRNHRIINKFKYCRIIFIRGGQCSLAAQVNDWVHGSSVLMAISTLNVKCFDRLGQYSEKRNTFHLKGLAKQD